LSFPLYLPKIIFGNKWGEQKDEVFGWGFRVFFFFGKLPKKKAIYPSRGFQKNRIRLSVSNYDRIFDIWNGEYGMNG